MESLVQLSSLAGKTLAIWGLGITGMATVRACSRSGVRCLVWDDREDARQELEGTQARVIDLSRDSTWEDRSFSSIVISPGIPHDHHVYRLASTYGVSVVSDIDLLYNHSKEARYIGVTGTNGKSTTAALTHRILSSAGISCCLGGNIGRPVLDLPVLESGGWYVIEMSSFQLAQTQDIKFNIAILLNLSPDHLDFHNDFKSYRAAKMRIVRHQTTDDTFIVGVDSVTNMDCAIDVAARNRLVVPIGTHDVVPGGYGWIGDILFSARTPSPRPVLDVSDMVHMRGEHNRQNVAAAVAVAETLDLSHEAIRSGVRSFEGLKHRLQKIASIGKVHFFNDSKATNVSAALRALQSFESCFWIAGGQAKQGDDWAGVVASLGNVKAVYLFGESAAMIQSVVASYVPSHICTSLDDAVRHAYTEAIAHDSGGVDQTVCFSPGCASFDMFRNYAERGETFITSVEALGISIQPHTGI